MTNASRRVQAGTPDRTRRWHRWTGALLTALVHLLLVLLVMLSPPITVTTPQGADAGGALQVTYIDDTRQPPPPVREPSIRPPAARPPAKAARAATRVRTTPVPQAVDPVPPDAAVAAPTQAPSETTVPPDVPDETPQQQPPAPDASPPPPMRRSSPQWGQPPGMLPEDIAPVNAGAGRSSIVNRGRRNDAAFAGSDMEVGGYQVYYDLIGEIRLAAWRDQGMTEISLPLPGTRRIMVCPLEVALKRGSGKCRLVEPDSPELKTIGDARQVINMQRVYKLGEELWSGPGAYR